MAYAGTSAGSFSHDMSTCRGAQWFMIFMYTRPPTSRELIAVRAEPVETAQSRRQSCFVSACRYWVESEDRASVRKRFEFVWGAMAHEARPFHETDTDGYLDRERPQHRPGFL
jgi:hypothetical protein